MPTVLLISLFDELQYRFTMYSGMHINGAAGIVNTGNDVRTRLSVLLLWPCETLGNSWNGINNSGKKWMSQHVFF